MEREPLLTVIVACYKTEEFFERCLNSLFHSEYTNLEILLIDDGSPDNCPKLCDEYAKKDARIKVIHKQNGGGWSAKNLGIDVAKGEYIAICDNDDMVTPEGYRLLMEKAVETDADMVQGTVRRTNLNNNDVRLWKRSEDIDLKSKLIGFQSAIFRTELLRKYDIKLQPYRVGDDISFMIQVMNHAKNIQYIDGIVYEYLIRLVTSKGASAIQMKDFNHYYDELRWREWTLAYINKSEKLMSEYGNQLGRFCMVMDEQWLSFTEEERDKCFELLKKIVSYIDWEHDEESVKGYLKVDKDSFMQMSQNEYTKVLRRQLKWIMPIKAALKKIVRK